MTELAIALAVLVSLVCGAVIYGAVKFGVAGFFNDVCDSGEKSDL